MAKITYPDGVVVEGEADEVREILSKISLSPKQLSLKEQTCIECHRTKPLAEFHRQGKGRRNQCKRCVMLYQRAWRARKAKAAREKKVKEEPEAAKVPINVG